MGSRAPPIESTQSASGLLYLGEFGDRVTRSGAVPGGCPLGPRFLRVTVGASSRPLEPKGISVTPAAAHALGA